MRAIVVFITGSFLGSYYSLGRKKFTFYVNLFIGKPCHNHTCPEATSSFEMLQLKPDAGPEGRGWLIGFLYIFIIMLLINSPKESFSQTSKSHLTLKVGQCDTLKVDSEMGEKLIWATGNQDVADINDQGIVCGILNGQTYITALTEKTKKVYQFTISIEEDEILKSNQLNPDASVANGICEESRKALNKIIDFQNKHSTDSKIVVSKNKRYLVDLDKDAPLLFISQTLWAMTRRLTREEIIKVLDICKDQGFTAIQLIAHAHYMGENVYGDLPFKNENFLCPILTEGDDFSNDLQYDWWDHLEFIITECVKRDLIICLLPTWREQWNQKANLTKNNAFAYGKFIGTRYRHFNKWIIWVMGGDAAPDTENKLKIHRELAKGISYGVNEREYYENLTMTYHTYGPSITNTYFPDDEAFMDFNTIQSGHGLNNLEGMIEESMITQNKPTVDFEPHYDKNGRLINETRTTIYWGIFSGGFGTSYGSWNIWHCGALDNAAKFNIPESFEISYSPQIKHIKKVLTPSSIEKRIPNQDVLLNNLTTGHERILANTSLDSSFIYVFSPKGESFTLDLKFIKGDKLQYTWLNPATGVNTFEGLIEKEADAKTFHPPTKGEIFSGNDWILKVVEQ